MTKNNLIKLEDLFYKNLLNNLTETDTIRLNKKYIPKNENNGLIRFFKKDQIWFSRLKYSNGIMYYFGLMKNNLKEKNLINPELILKFDNTLKKSNIRIKDKKLLIVVKLQQDIEYYKNLEFNFKKANSKENSKLRFLILEDITSDNIISSIKDILSEFTFNFDMKSHIIEININNPIKNFKIDKSKTEINTYENENSGDIEIKKSQYNPSFIIKDNIKPILDEIKLPETENYINDDLYPIIFNINAFHLLNKIINLNLDNFSKEELIKYIFNRTDDNNFIFSSEIINFFKDNIIDESYIFYILNLIFDNDLSLEQYYSEINSLFNFKLSKNYDSRKNNITNKINDTKENENIITTQNNTILNDSSYEYDEELEIKLFKYDENDLIKILIKNKNSIDALNDLTENQINTTNFNYNQIVNLILRNLKTDEINSELKKFKQYKVKEIVKKNFTFKKSRELQLETISKIYDAIEKGYKYIILEAVSGFGKSSIATTLSNIYSEDKSFILTTTNQLINQYIDSFNDIKIHQIKPRSKFSCKKNKYSCSELKCNYSKCIYYKNSNSKKLDETKSCEYLYNLNKGQNSNIVICTYDYFLNETFYHSNNIKPRKLIICDEGHNIDDKIAQSIRLKINEKQFNEELKIDMDKEYTYIHQDEDYYYYLLKFKKTYESEMEKISENSKKYVQYKKRLNDIKRFMSYFDRSNDNLIFQTNIKHYKRKDFVTWQFKPVTVKNIINDCLLDYGDVCIFMSSSIFDHENFAYDLNINPNEIYSLRVPNTFDLSNNPIKIYENFNMNNENIENGIMEDTIHIIKEILKNHKNEKGIIHTTNYEQSNFIENNVNDSRIINHYNTDREDTLNYFINSKKSLVLISPSMNEGVDLPEELCRFQIIYKLPYLPSNDPRIEKRKNTYEDGEEWYRYKMITRLIQGYGRGIRNENDYCKTYILDNRLLDVIYEDLETKNIIPKYFINSIENLDKN